MKKRRYLIGMIAFLLVPLLLAGCGISPAEYGAVLSDLDKAQKELQSVKAELTTAQAKNSELTSSLSKVQAELTGQQGTKADVKMQQELNQALSEELNRMKSPRHFLSVVELTNWLHEDDTDYLYAYERWINMSLILQIRAQMDGFLLPAAIYSDGYDIYVENTAVIGDEVYTVYADDDSIIFVDYITPVPSRPLPIE